MSLWLICLCLEGKKNNSKAEEIIACARTSEELKSFAGLHSLLSFSIIFTSLASLVGLHFQVLGISPLKRHFTIILLFLMATVVYSICLYEDEFTTSQKSVPSHIQVHLSDFWNYCLCATCCNTHLSSCCSKLIYAQSSL